MTMWSFIYKISIWKPIRSINPTIRTAFCLYVQKIFPYIPFPISHNDFRTTPSQRVLWTALTFIWPNQETGPVDIDFVILIQRSIIYYYSIYNNTIFKYTYIYLWVCFLWIYKAFKCCPILWKKCKTVNKVSKAYVQSIMLCLCYLSL